MLSHYYNLVRGPSLVSPQIAHRRRHLDHKDGTTVGHVKAIEWNNCTHNVFLCKQISFGNCRGGVLVAWCCADKAWSGCLRSSGPPTLGCLGIRRHLLAAAFLRWLHNNSCCTLLCPTSPSLPQNYLSKPDQRQNECKTTRVRPVESLLTLEKTDLDGDYVVSLHTLV